MNKEKFGGVVEFVGKREKKLTSNIRFYKKYFELNCKRIFNCLPNRDSRSLEYALAYSAFLLSCFYKSPVCAMPVG